MNNKKYIDIPLVAALIPITLLIVGIVLFLVTNGADDIQLFSQPLLILCGFVALSIAIIYRRPLRRPLKISIGKSFTQAVPVLAILLLIGTVSATWMFSGVVPTLICYGMEVLNPNLFLVTACCICAAVSVMSGSSWTTIATIGVAFMGIGIMWGYSPGWIAGAIISGAYFGDKVSPLSDTTVLASSTCGVPLMSHIRYMMFTTIPAMSLAIIVYLLVGLNTLPETGESNMEILDKLHGTFNITPLCLLIPVATLLILALRAGTIKTLVISTVLGIIGIFMLQPQLLPSIGSAPVSDSAAVNHIHTIIGILTTRTSLNMDHPLLDSLVTTGGMAGMIPTITLVLSALFFGTAMMASGLLSVIINSIMRRLKRKGKIVSSTAATGLLLNCFTGDQYLSIILCGNIYRNLYRRRSLDTRLLSRTIEDSTSVTSVLIPWNSCGLTQSAVLGVATLAYFPFCIFNIASPLVTLLMGFVSVGSLKRQVA
ncbi:Na+/H+ antiporter NhaC family protein [uncultured Muribaculum sp.]|uniref:Na+/H+ antiporter NhaC family protein n=1 Tax=uncultured Muribaculum sp. TaxID=1918613 RepID=UPI0025AF91E7|nr:Na+/H+ antiporter NhaC family protein [uncultured Muribaculum sp.]